MASATGSNISKRGFASMDPDKQRELARRGGRAAHEKGNAHEFSAEEARDAGRKGGERVSADRTRMAEIGRRGGLISAARRAAIGKSPVGQQVRESNSAPDGSVKPSMSAAQQPPVEQSASVASQAAS